MSSAMRCVGKPPNQRKQEIAMSATDVPKMNLENHLVPVTDVDRAKGFYAQLGWRLDDDAGGSTRQEARYERSPSLPAGDAGVSTGGHRWPNAGSRRHF